MENIIHSLLIIPIVGFLLSLLVSNKNEKTISLIAFLTVGLTLIAALGLLSFWIYNGATVIDVRDLNLYHSVDYSFSINFYFDVISMVFLLVGTLLTLLVTVYSRYYMHRESGFKRFFNTILFFFIGFNLTVLSGNFETLFIGWEILGISSFLLIAFYRLRYMPVKNAIKVFSIYRIGDVGMLLAMWMSHHLWNENITFLKLSNETLVHEQLQNHSTIGIFISLMILVAAAAKSAQLPFSAWLPRAMEGPTPSSAIFYGSLSVHFGAFLLLRTYPFWEHQTSIRILIMLLGISTSIVCSLIARVQSTVKGQIAYSSAAQIGIIFLEIAAGWQILALFHFAGNAFLRTYQLLISPSMVSYMIREQFYNHQVKPIKVRSVKMTKFLNSIYLQSLKEWKLDTFIFRFYFDPIKKLRNLISFISLKNVFYYYIPLYLVGVYFAYFYDNQSLFLKNGLAIISALLAFIMVVKAFNERSSSRLSWVLIVLSHFYIDLAITFNDHFNAKEAIIYLSGILVSGLIGYFCLKYIKGKENIKIGMNKFHGLIESNKTVGFVFFLSCLGLAGFPITTTFFGEDLILTHIHEDQIILAFLVASTFILNGIAVIRIYARLFLGAHQRNFQKAENLTR